MGSSGWQLAQGPTLHKASLPKVDCFFPAPRFGWSLGNLQPSQARPLGGPSGATEKLSDLVWMPVPSACHLPLSGLHVIAQVPHATLGRAGQRWEWSDDQKQQPKLRQFLLG